MTRRRIVIASKNPDKVREVTDVLNSLADPPAVVADAEWPDVAETADTLEGNALIKARAAVAATGVTALADDTGLEVDALGGLPGVHTARFAGPDASYEENVAHLLREMQGRADRRARFRTAIAVVTPEGGEVVTEGVLEGRIAHEPRGDHGFGYDPVFEVGAKTLGEMTADDKAEISHRARALRSLAARWEATAE